MQKKMYEEWKAATGHPDEAEADSILPGSAAKRRTPEQDETAGRGGQWRGRLFID